MPTSFKNPPSSLKNLCTNKPPLPLCYLPGASCYKVSNCIAPSSEHSGNKALPQWLGRVSQGLSKTGSLSNTSVLSTAIPPSACPWRPFLGLTQAPVRSPALYPPGTIPQLITTIANFLFPSRHPSYSYSPSPPPPLHYVLKRL